MDYGVYTSDSLEIVRTKLWTLCLYGNSDKSVIGARLYRESEAEKTLMAVCQRNQDRGETVYAYSDPGGNRYTNDAGGIDSLIGSPCGDMPSRLHKVEAISLSSPRQMPTVSKAGIKACLSQWRMGSFCDVFPGGILFQLVTNRLEYVFSIQQENCDIYCGASVAVPSEQGMFGGNQYFRLRNYADNSENFCRFVCDLGGEPAVPDETIPICGNGCCAITGSGFFWPLKRYTEDEIVLTGCGDDEYIYRRNRQKSEYFSCDAAKKQ